MARRLFSGKADYFLQQASPITSVKWYHINQNLTRWQIWSYQIPRDTVTNMSLSQVLSVGMPLPYQIYHPPRISEAFQGKLPYSEKWKHKWYENVNRKTCFGAVERVRCSEREWSHYNTFSGQSWRKNSGVSLDLRPFPLTFYIMKRIYHIMTATSEQ